MRILSWNINGIRTLPQYHPWNTFKSCEEILGHLGADIICFQEMKTSRSALDRNVGLPGRFHSFFSFPANKGGYSSVAVYTNSHTVVPLKAEEGLSGLLQPKPPLTPDERISISYPSVHDIDLVADAQGNKSADLTILDCEGRALVLDLGLFVLINLYCPNETSDERLVFKMNYHLMLHERVRRLIDEGREVIVLGDINICSTPLDHGEGHLTSRSNGFYEHPARAWFHTWLDPEGGPMVDVVRKFWPERKGMYTCWNTKIQARETNYGTRVDYILSTRGLLPWFKHGDIQASVKGSDHCPIYVDLHDEITLPSGETLTLRDAMHMTDTPRDPPRLAAKYWDEYSGKQTLLSTFFGKQRSVSSTPDPTVQSHIKDTSSNSPPLQSSVTQSTQTQPSQSSETSSTPASPSPVTHHPPPRVVPFSSSTNPSLSKRKSDAVEPPRGKIKKQKSGQTKLSSFFAKPTASQKVAPTKADAIATASVVDLTEDTSVLVGAAIQAHAPIQTQRDNNKSLALATLQECESSPNRLVQPASSQSKTAWSQLLAPIKPPRCTVHGEPAKEYTVNKQGPNKGKNFFICSRPVGPGYDKGRSERLREEVDPAYRCNFFKWSSDVKRESIRKEREAG